MTTPSEILDRMPPSDTAAERMLLGCLMMDPERLPEIAAVVRPGDFYAQAHTTIYRTLLALQGDGAVDVELLARRLKAEDKLEAIGGMAYLAEVVQSVPVAAHARHYAEIVRQKSAYRAVIEAGLDLVRRGYLEDAEPRELLDGAEQRLAAVETDAHQGLPVKARDAAAAAMAEVYRAHNTRQSSGLMTGLDTFDDLTGGLFPGQLCILAGRTSTGKTALACQIAGYAAAKGRGVYYASLEMSAMELATRMLCSEADVDSRFLKRAELAVADVDRLAGVSQPWTDMPLWIHDRPGVTIPEISRWARRLRREGLSLVVVDYLQLVTPGDRRIARHEQVGQMTAALKGLTRELDLPVLCLAQLSRKADEDDKHEPRLSHFRESGSIEQDADMALILWKNPQDQTGGETPVVRLLIKKNRSGPVGFVHLNWHASRTRFDCGTPANHEAAFDQYGGSDL